MTKSFAVLLLTAFGLCAGGLSVARAESFTTNIISGISTNIGGPYTLGKTGPYNYLEITNGGSQTNTDGTIGAKADAHHNTAVVTGTNSVWYNQSTLYVGGSTSGSSSYGNRLIITNGGRVSAVSAVVGYMNSHTNSVLVTGHGSVWECSGDLSVGYSGIVNQVMIEDGELVQSRDGGVGMGLGSKALVTVRDSGSRWTIRRTLIVGWAGPENRLVIAQGGLVSATNLIISRFEWAWSNTVEVAGGTLTVANHNGDAAIEGGLGGSGAIEQTAGLVVADRLILNNANSTYRFAGGELQSGQTIYSNGQPFVVGSTSNAATLQLRGGIHSFAAGLHITTNAQLSGCGTIIGSVINDGMIALDCTTTFSNTVINNASIVISNGALVEFAEPVVNDGLINAIHGSAIFHAGWTGSGTCLDADGDPDGDGFTNLQEEVAGTDPLNSASAPLIVSVVPKGDNLEVRMLSVAGRSYQLRRCSSLLLGDWEDIGDPLPGNNSELILTDPGGLTGAASRFYSVTITH